MALKKILFILKTQEEFAPFKNWLEGSAYQPELLSPDTVSKLSLASGTGYDAVLKEAKNYFLLLLDIDVPWALQLCRLFKSEQRGKEVPLVMTANRAKLGEVTSAIQAGADNFVMKPMEKDYFLGRLSVIEKEIELSQAHKKLIDLALLRFTFTLMTEEAAEAECFILFKAAFERAILEKANFILGGAIVSTALRSTLTRVERQYSFLESLKWEEGQGLFIDQAIAASTGENKEKIISACKTLASNFLEIVHILTSDILVGEKI